MTGRPPVDARTQARIDAHVARLVADTPPLNDVQIAQLRQILHGEPLRRSA
jgi:hypothetical protein